MPGVMAAVNAALRPPMTPGSAAAALAPTYPPEPVYGDFMHSASSTLVEQERLN